jgi:hypothetical protein
MSGLSSTASKKYSTDEYAAREIFNRRQLHAFQMLLLLRIKAGDALLHGHLDLQCFPPAQARGLRKDRTAEHHQGKRWKNGKPSHHQVACIVNEIHNPQCQASDCLCIHRHSNEAQRKTRQRRPTSRWPAALRLRRLSMQNAQSVGMTAAEHSPHSSCIEGRLMSAPTLHVHGLGSCLVRHPKESAHRYHHKTKGSCNVSLVVVLSFLGHCLGGAAIAGGICLSACRWH